jgi:hypothetical protein
MTRYAPRNPSSKLRRFATTLFFLCSNTQARMHEIMSSNDHPSSPDKDEPYCPCQLLPKPDLWDKALTARWMAHSIEWGILSTISSRLPKDNHEQSVIMPFGNVYSFVDGSCDNSTGIPYFYGTFLDQSFQDIQRNPYASLTLSEASLATVCGGSNKDNNQNHLLAACDASKQTKGYYGDVESPVCARLTLSGRIMQVDKETDEYKMAQQALFQRHPDMEGWVCDILCETFVCCLICADAYFLGCTAKKSRMDHCQVGPNGRLAH